jgi:large subunit ribosomal protein L9
MKVLLKENIPSLGKMGELVEVARGYGRNFLIPYGKAVEATTKNVKVLEELKKKVEIKLNQEKQAAEVLISQFQDLTLTIPARVGEGERLYGSVGTREVAEALAGAGIKMDKKRIYLEQPIKNLGEHLAEIRLPQGLQSQLRIVVVKENA